MRLFFTHTERVNQPLILDKSTQDSISHQASTQSPVHTEVIIIGSIYKKDSCSERILVSHTHLDTIKIIQYILSTDEVCQNRQGIQNRENSINQDWAINHGVTNVLSK